MDKNTKKHFHHSSLEEAEKDAKEYAKKYHPNAMSLEEAAKVLREAALEKAESEMARKSNSSGKKVLYTN